MCGRFLGCYLSIDKGVGACRYAIEVFGHGFDGEVSAVCGSVFVDGSNMLEEFCLALAGGCVRHDACLWVWIISDRDCGYVEANSHPEAYHDISSLS